MPDTDDDERGWQGRELIDRDGDAVGLILSVDLDNAGEPAWARVETAGSGVATCVVPLAAATLDGPVVRVPYDRALILAAPTAEGALSSNEEALLVEHYGVDQPATMEPDEPSGNDAGSGEGGWDDRPRWESTGDASDGDGDDGDWDDRPRWESTGDASDGDDGDWDDRPRSDDSGGDIGDF